ncbi:3'5'-cyclic nucleotide phosphodiesterase, partial [Globisporangium splendens]
MATNEDPKDDASGLKTAFVNGASESARRRWRLLQKHVRITQWLSKDLLRRHLKRFALSQQSIVDAVMHSKDDFMEVFVKIREQFLSLLDAENCFIIFEAKRSTLEFDGRTIYPSSRAKRGLLRESLRSGQPLHLPCPSTCENAQISDGIPNIEVRSYVCIPLIDGDNNVQAAAEIFNSRYDARVINAWLSETSNGSLHVFRTFVGKIIKAFTKRSNISEIVSSSVSSFSQSLASAPLLPSPSSAAEVSFASLGHHRDRKESASGNDAPIEPLVDLLRQSVAVEQCVVYAYDKESNILWARLSESSTYCPATVNFGDGVIGKAALSGELLHLSTRACTSINSATADAADIQALMTSLHLTSSEIHDVLLLPTFNGNHQVNGVVLLRNKKDQSSFNESDIAITINICRHIGSALHSSELHDAIQKAQGKAQTLLDLSAVLFRELETNSLLIAIMDAIKKPMNASKCSTFIMNEDNTELYSPVGSDINCDLAQEAFRIPVTWGIVGAAVQSGEIINVPDAYQDPRFNQTIDKQTGFITRSILAVPIKDANGRVLGVLAMINKLSKQYFDKDDEELARGIAYYLAIALNNARLFEEARSAMRRSDALLALMQVMSSANENVGDVFKGIAETVSEILHVEHGELFFVDALSKSLFCRMGSSWKGYSLPLGKYIQGIVAEKGEVVNLVSPTSHPDFNHEYDKLVGVKTRNLLCVPVKSSQRHGEENVIAVFYAANKVGKPHARFCEEDVKILVAICGELKSIIERRAWELVFEAESSEGNEMTQVTSSYLSQFTSTPTLSRRRSHSSLRSRTTSPPLTPASAPSSGHNRESAATSFSGEMAPKKNSVANIIRSWELDPWEYTAPQLVDLAMDIFDYYDLLTRFQVPRATMRRFLVGVKSQYQDIPYHNFYHAFTTLHVSFMIVSSQPISSLAILPSKSTPAADTVSAAAAALAVRATSSGTRPLLEVRDLMAIFVAAFCHDMNHNGRTNDFHIRYRTSIAMLYNDQSVLENMHAAACFDTMRRPGHDILEHIDATEYRHIRKSIIRAILATDMHNHAGIVSQLHEKLNADVFNSDDETHKELLINAIVHSADISGPTLVEKLHIKWSLQLLQEFNMQYEEETSLGMVPTPYMNAKPDTPELCKLNVAFIDSCVFPLWSAMDTFLGGLGGCLTNIQTNRSMWVAKLEAQQQQQQQ